MTVIFYHAAPGETIDPKRPSQSVRHIYLIS